MKDLVMDWGERLILILLFAMFTIANIRSGDPVNDIILIGEGLTAFFVLTRRRAISISDSPMDWALAFCGTLLPMAARPGGEPLAGWLAGLLLAGGTFVALAAKLSLNRRFGIAPANRGVQIGWAYAVVRHPMYLGYMIAQVGYLLHNPTLRNCMLYALVWLFQVARITREERHLMADVAYQAYASRVRRRLVPGVY
jgi:protein-S-isoprenylcysteine O-methyltransferase Ste14